MPATVILGAQWGDEGKGKLVDRLAEQADFLDKENLIEVLEALMPADYEFGKYDDDYFTNTVITALFRQVINQVEWRSRISAEDGSLGLSNGNLTLEFFSYTAAVSIATSDESESGGN